MVKNGTDAKGRTKWRCQACRIVATRTRPDTARRAEFTAFYRWISGHHSATEAAAAMGVSRRTFDRRIAWCWLVTPPPPVFTGRIWDQICIDGTYIDGHCLLLATSGRTVVAWHWCRRENADSYRQLLHKIPAPLIVVCDGHRGSHAAITDLWPETVIQRCLVHIQRAVTSNVSTRPKTTAGKAARALALQLTRVTSTDQATAWLTRCNTAYSEFSGWLNQRTYRDQVRPDAVPAWAAPGQKWWYTHRETRRAFRLLTSLAAQGHLFSWLTPPAAVLEPAKLSPTTNALEGGFNAPIKRLVDAHRGITGERLRRLIDWYLLSYTEFPPDPIACAKEQNWGQTSITYARALAHRDTEHERVGVDEDGRPATYDRGIETEYTHSIGIQKGWVGRY